MTEYQVIICTTNGETEQRNTCWQCNRYFDILNPDNYLPLGDSKQAGKMYLHCNHCMAVNHL